MIKRNSYLIIILTCMSFCFNACYVCDKYYVPINSGTSVHSFKDSIIDLNCSVLPGEKHEIVVTLKFDLIDSTHIESIIMNAISNGKIIPLKSVKMENYGNCVNSVTSYVKTNKFEQESFNKLPSELTSTSIRNEPTLYVFHFQNEKTNIDSKMIELNVSIILKRQREGLIFTRKYSLIKKKNCSFRIH